MEGFIVKRWLDRWDEGINYNLQLIKEVKSIQTQIHIIISKSVSKEHLKNKLICAK
jgi:3-polyprenyl-4-hydroxybenzoate decarboxylase